MLIITILLLLMLTILGVGAMSLNTTQTRIATNTADAQIAFQTAEGALSQAQALLATPAYDHKAFPAGTPGFYAFVAANAAPWTTVDWTSSSAVLSFQGNARNPGAFIIEQLGSTPIPGYSISLKNNIPQIVNWNYRITAHATGASGGSPVMLQVTAQIQGDQ
ncbi:MAG: pilus assembly protein [Burkholderiaceae bacterium]